MVHLAPQALEVCLVCQDTLEVMDNQDSLVQGASMVKRAVLVCLGSLVQEDLMGPREERENLDLQVPKFCCKVLYFVGIKLCFKLLKNSIQYYNIKIVNYITGYCKIPTTES